MLVQYVDGEGFIYAQPIGGWDPQVLIGQRMTIWTATARCRRSSPASRSICSLTKNASRFAKLKDLWIDIGAKDKRRCDVGGSDRRPDHAGDEVPAAAEQLACSPAMDDKCGLWVVLEAFRRASTRPLDCALYVVSTVQEEIGLRGARPAPLPSMPRSALPSM